MIAKFLPSVPAMLATIGVVAAISVLLGLGFWQLDRAEQKQARIEQITTRQSTSEYSLQDILALSGDIDDYPVYLDGQFDQQKYFLWDNRVLDGKVGYEVLAPLFTDAGTVVVNLGWIPLRDSRDYLPDIQLPKQISGWQGVVLTPSENPLIRQVTGFESWPYRIQQPDMPLMAEILEQELLPFLIYLREPDVFADNWKPVVMPPQKHLGYAVQWFGLAIACTLVFSLVVIRQRGVIHGK